MKAQKEIVFSASQQFPKPTMSREEAIEVLRVLDNQGIRCTLSAGEDYIVRFDPEGISGDDMTKAISAIKNAIAFDEDIRIQFASGYLTVI